jgi:2-amino-4-hydroxy-6-hydroxymethyldihydropteridine diphosphokinase
MQPNRAHLLLGSNLGNKKKYLTDALVQIERSVGKIILQSSLYDTDPWGNSNQDTFLNQAICIETGHSAELLLQNILHIEKMLGRNRSEKWEARIIDIDILLFNSEVINIPGLSIPHPFMHERRFVLVPLVEIAHHFIHPVLQKPIAELLHECQDLLKVMPVSSKSLSFT